MTKLYKAWTICIALAMTLAPASCGIVNRVGESCPSEAKFAAVWSSEQSNSLLTFYDETGPIGKKRIEVKGFAPEQDFVKSGVGWIGVSNGNKSDSSVHIVRINPATCQVTKTEVGESQVWDFTADSRGVYTVASGLVSEAHYHSATGKHLYSTIGEELAELIVATDDELLILTSGFERQANHTLQVLDTSTLEAKWKIHLPVASLSATAKVVGDTLYFAEPRTTSDTPSNQLIAVHLKTKKITKTKLLSKMPNVLATIGTTLYVGSTFPDSGSSSPKDMKAITAVDLATGRQRLLTAEHGVSHLQVTKDRLVAYGSYDSEYNVAVTSYRMPELTPEYSLKLKRPASMGHMYGAGFLLLGTS